MTGRDPTAMPNVFRADNIADLSARSQDLIARRARALGPAYRLFYERPLEFVRGEGCWLTSANGDRYLDAYNNVAAMGHCHPAIVEAVSAQLGRLNTHTRYLDEQIVQYAEDLLSLFPAELSQVMFTCTGSEANDLALRVARHHTQARGVIVTANAYHGVTEAVAAISPALGPHRGDDSHVRYVRPRGVAIGDPDRLMESVAEAIGSLQRDGHGVAAIMLDTIFSTDGVLPRVDDLAGAIELVRQAGGLFIADEVQAGFGRVGPDYWGFRLHGLIPDLVTLGKPMANGYPVGALVAQPDFLSRFGRDNRYFNTFAGGQVAAVAAAATLREILRPGLLQSVAAVGQYMREGLLGLARSYSAIGDVRVAGLSIGVELVRSGAGEPDPEMAAHVVNSLASQKVLISATGPDANVLKIRPPLIFDQDHADIVLAALRKALHAR